MSCITGGDNYCKILYDIKKYGRGGIVGRMKKIVDWVTIKFLIVGVINTLVGTTVMFVAYNLIHLSYWVSSAANYVIGSIVSYVLNKHFTFQNKDKSPKVLLKFILNISVCYVLAYGLAKPLTMKILSGVSVNIQENVAMLVGRCLFVVFNYVGQRYFAFKIKE